MAIKGIEDAVEALSEAVVFLEPNDLNALADMHGQLEEVGSWAGDAGHSRTVAAIQETRDLIEKVILEESDDPARSVEVIGEMVSALQRLVRDGVDDSQIVYPPELGVSKPTAAAASAAPQPATDAPSAATPTPQPAPSRFTVELPPYVDEAIFSEFLARQDSVLEEIETALLEIEQGTNEQAQRTLARHLHTLKGETALLGLSDIERLVHTAEDLMESESPAILVERMLALKDWLKQAFDACAGTGGAPPSVEEMLGVLKGSRDSGISSLAAEEAVDQAAPAALPHPPPPPATPPAVDGEDRPLTGDRELIADFVVEASEHLENCDVQLLTLEMDPHNPDAIDAVFRAVHTIKGVCGFIDLTDMQSLSHESEHLLDRARKHQIVLEGVYLDILFDTIDMLKRLLVFVREALEGNTLLRTCSDLPALLQAVVDLVHGRDVTTWKHGIGAVESDYQEMENALIETLGEGHGNTQVGDILLHMGAVSEEALAKTVERQQAPTGENSANGNGQKAPEQARPPIGEMLVRQGDAQARDVAHALRAQKKLRTDEAEARPAGAAAPPKGAPPEPPSGPPAGAPASGGPTESSSISVRETVKVDASRLDQLVDMIGELVIAESMVCQSRELVGNLSTELSRHVSQLDKITRELQEMAMGLRMVPVRSTFQKMARLVRDVARKTGKEVNFTMQGEDTELDKTVVDRISDPLVHMIRNAVDHGLEGSGDERRAAGKPSAGNVTLRAYHSGGSIQIEISDDGKGLDRDAILAKAIERGLVSDSGEQLSNKDVWQLIFEPGFSTAKQLTEVSGRGVGMDVVRRNIEALRGEIDIHSELGKGSRFTIRLPLTLAIIDGMVIRTGTERFIIPTLSIVVSVRPRQKDLGTVVGAAETMRLQGEIIPLFRLHDLFDLDGCVTKPTEGTVIVLENGGKRAGLLIDEILGQQQIVIKSLGASLRGARGIAGGAIMPDGRVGLIIDVGELLKLATEAAPA